MPAPTIPDPQPALSSSTTGLRALIVKFGSIGDVVMALPGVAALHGEGYAIDWVVSKDLAPVLALYPWVHPVLVDEGVLLRGKWSSRMAAAAVLWRTLRSRVQARGEYTLLATLYYDRRYDLLTRGIPARRRILLSKGDRRFALLPGRHHTDEYARILLGQAEGERATAYAPVPAQGLPTFAEGGQGSRPRVVLIPGGARNALRDDALRRWPVESYVALAERLLRGGYAVVLAGGPDDRWTSAHFAKLARCAPEGALADLVGTLTLVQTLALFEAAEVAVIHDTGPLHLAGITSTAIVTLFGPTDPHGRLPRRANVLALWGGEGFACRPCYDGRDYAPCLHNGCMSQITPERVFTEVVRLHEARQRGVGLPPEILAPPAAPSLVQLPAGRA